MLIPVYESVQLRSTPPPITETYRDPSASAVFIPTGARRMGRQSVDRIGSCITKNVDIDIFRRQSQEGKVMAQEYSAEDRFRRWVVDRLQFTFLPNKRRNHSSPVEKSTMESLNVDFTGDAVVAPEKKDQDDIFDRFINPEVFSTTSSSWSPATKALHADDETNGSNDVAPPIHVTTTYRYPRNPDQLRPHHERSSYPVLDIGEHCYSRQSTPGMTRLETLLASVLGHPCITYSSGLASLHALLNMVKPKRVAIGNGYHGSHGTLELFARVSDCKILPLDCSIEELGEGDLIHLETPVNPTGMALDIQHYADRAHSRGAYLCVDSTFAPPPLQNPFLHGADVVMHSATKYIGGHSDLLCGTLVVPDDHWLRKLYQDRLYLGSVMPGFDSWLATRSIRTLEMRVLRQSQSAEFIVQELHAALTTQRSTVFRNEDIKVVKSVVKELRHASLQPEAKTPGWLQKQMPRGYGSVFVLILRRVEFAKKLPSKLLLFNHATSLGGVESLIEWRTMTDSTVAKDVLRISVGIEDPMDLLFDLMQGLRGVLNE